ncbi:hypothetical protein CIK52_08670 [Kocuria rosea]|uniref:glycosyltransferase family 2 protein n=1 Tax=Kocuria rosea TaxID=1275 RepID=UPI000D64AB90|nr:glycosyltransferase family A protein [Kocuria rosea]PWF86367.1 hypothetical protein CIK52_08670 [Kocuria rosea]QCY33869.1 glycosyltransferase [Kocuria rosea]TQN35571.1 glycosyl transferase family 2 [Kocuria rosea]
MSSAPTPLVDVIIPVHTTARPVDRAVGSVLAGGLPVGDHGGVHITVVCHNVEAALIRDRLAAEHRPLVELLECFDGTGNPAGPRNLALERSRARYVSFVDSDDTLAPGALAAWTATAERHGSAAVLPRLVKDSGRPVRTPVPRPFRRADLDPVKDRLAYRTHVFGLLRRELLVDRGVRFNGRYATGEDQELVARAWFGDGRVDLAPRGAGYLLREGAADRISAAPRPLTDDLAAATDLLGGSWYAGLSVEQRTAIAAKILRVQVFGAVRGGRPPGGEPARAGQVARPPGARRAVLRGPGGPGPRRPAGGDGGGHPPGGQRPSPLRLAQHPAHPGPAQGPAPRGPPAVHGGFRDLWWHPPMVEAVILPFEDG